MSPPQRKVLPANVKPVHYDLGLKPDLTTFKFDGEVTIALDVKETSDFIELHTLELELSEVQLSTKEGQLAPRETSYSKDEQSTTFKFGDNVLKAGESVQLYIKFVGELNDKLSGFYRSSYTENGETKYLATTQMEATDCRRAFPCFDEPNLKATFSISIVADKQYTCLSNMDVKEEKPVSETQKKVIFNKTPPMSTYLVAFIVGDLKYVESEYKFRDIPVRVYTTPGYEKEGQYSAELAAKALEYYEKVFDIPYPLPKMDMVGIHDFSAGAMENWGLVTYRMVDLLVNETKTNLATKLRVSEVVAHELAHQWFGNICTMDFWDSLWLNESFATYMSWKCCDHFEKDWKIWENFVGDSLQMALSLDALRSSHPIEVPVAHADEINQIFDAISYEKGSAVLRMLANYLGEETFIKGVSHYVKKHMYANAVTEDLWASLSEVSGKDVQSTMNVWTKKVGYPLVQVSEDNGKVTIRQHRYLTTGDVKPEDDETVYPIFLSIRTDDGVKEFVFDKKEQELDLKSSDFFKLNSDTTGVFRVNYEPERWHTLGAAADKLSVEDRIGLVADAGALSVSGYSKTTNLLSLTSLFKNEPSFFVWSEMIARISAVKRAWLFEDESIKEGLKALVRSLVSDKCHKAGWKFESSEPFLEQRLKALLFSAAAANGDQKVIDAAKSLFAGYIGNEKSEIDPNLRGTVFSVAATHGSKKEFEALVNLYKETPLADEKQEVLATLGKFEDKELLTKVTDMLLDGTIRTQDVIRPMAGMATHKAGVEHLWDFVTSRWDEIVKAIPASLTLLAYVVDCATRGFTTMEQYHMVEEFFKDKDTKAFDQKLAQALESIESRAKWVSRDSKDVADWLKANGYSS
ncbi:hypothetical protein KL951_003553 [Ogataea haglerorum]|nr:hypothetical protein KL951_003553 [Ogataea haglerorum]